VIEIESANGLEIDATKRALVLVAIAGAATCAALLGVPSLVGRWLLGE